VLSINYWQKELPFEHPFTISKGTKTHQPIFVVELEWRGIKAYGEAPAISYYNVSTEKMREDVEQKKKFLENFSFTDPKRFWHFLHHLFPGNPFLVSALDMAGWDLYGKIRNQPLFKIWNVNPSSIPITDYTIGIDTIEKMLEKIAAHAAPVYKIKVGGKEDLEKLFAIRSKTDALLRVDANAGWTYSQAIELLPFLEQLKVELIEQPLSIDSKDEIIQLKKLSTIPLIADESFVSMKDFEHCKEGFDGINIKLTKCSGITPALELIKKARENQMKIMLGCMNESSIGTAAIVHLSPLVDFLDADGPLLLSEDLAEGLLLKDHMWQMPLAPGLGIRVKGSL
jgi:hypothetical protein